MNKLPKRKFGAVLSLFAMAAYVPVSGHAQTTATDDTKNQPVVLEKFQVTGSYLPVSASVTASPVVTIQSSEIGQAGATDPLRAMRQTTPFFSGNGNQGTEANNGAAGESYVALRNLTTLVLINGQRITGSPFQSGSLVDLNTIPTAAIERIEILKDGASTIYGTDAIGGVVNIILKKDYNGFEAGVRYGSTRNGDYKTREGYVTGGGSSDGFSMTVTAQHFENIPLLTTNRPLTTLTGKQEKAMGFNTTSAVFSGTYPGRVGSNVLAGSTLIAVGDPGFNASIVYPGLKKTPNDTSLTNGQTGAAALAYLISKGIYLPAAKTPAGQAVGGSATALNTTLFGNPLIENTKRNQFVANADKELIGKNLEVYADFLYSQTINGGSALAPSPIAGVGPGGGNTLFIPANNPYNVFNVDFPGPLSARTRTIELGKRTSSNQTDTWRVVLGLKGDIGDGYSWEANFNYSRASLVQRIFGGVNGANMNKAMVPLLDANGNYVYNAAGKPLSTLNDSSGNPLPVYNFFALPGFNDPATLGALTTTLFASGDTSLRNIQFIVRGKPITLPAGDVGFDLGVEDRHEDTSGSVDALFANGLALGYNAAATFPGGSRSSKAAFVEVGMPITSPKQNYVGLHTLELNLADRYEKVKPGGNVNSPKFGIRWLPFSDELAVRGTYAEGFIAPTIFNLFGPSAQNSPTFAILEGNGNAGPGGSKSNLTTIQGSTNEISNPNLQSSKSKSYTAGIVYSPKYLKGLSITLDYYYIKQAGGVGTIDYTSVIADLNAKGSASSYAPGFTFADGSRLTSTTPNQVNSTNFGLLNIVKNFTGSQYTSGLDVAVDYQFTTSGLGRFDVGAQANILGDYKARATPSAPYLQYARNFTDQSNSAGNTNGLLPGYVIKPYLNHTYGPLTTSVLLSYVAPTNTTGGVPYDPAVGDPDTVSGKPYRIPGYFTADLSVTYKVPTFGNRWLDNFAVTVGVNNVFNKQPPYVPVDGNPPGENNTVESTYDIIGRFYFAQIKKSF